MRDGYSCASYKFALLQLNNGLLLHCNININIKINKNKNINKNNTIQYKTKQNIIKPTQPKPTQTKPNPT